MSQRLLIPTPYDEGKFPEWLTQEYFERCLADKELQEHWEPKVGDWYFCKDFCLVIKIETLKDYYSEGNVKPLKTDSLLNSKMRWDCDIYIPEPR